MSIKKKMFAFFGALMIGFILVLVAADIFFAGDFFIRESKNQMNEICSNIKDEFPQFEQSDLHEFDDYIESINEQRNVKILVVNDYDQILFRQNDITSRGYQSYKLSNRMSEAFHNNIDTLNSGGECYEVFTNENDALRKVILMSKLDDNYYLILSRSLSSIRDNVHISNKLIIIIGLIMFIIGTVIVVFFARRLSNSIIQINSAARRIANLDFEQKVSVKDKGEIGELANSINIISDKLSDSINSLKDDVVSREQLIRDMSHEFKTPIAAVKGYAEGLKFGIANTPEKVEKYCDVIVNQCDKMDNLVKSMLNLSKIDSMKTDGEKSTFLISELSETIESSFEMKLLDKHINFVKNEYPEKSIYADFILMQQAISNYLDNAIRHTSYEGTVELNYFFESNGFKVTVFNTGETIDDNELEHLWDVFYKVDKSRTQNGTANYGVGLAIVKKVADIHNGKVWVKNRDNGVLFGIFIPQS